MAGGTYTYNSKNYTGKNLLSLLSGKQIIEVVNEIDESKYYLYTEDGATINTDLVAIGQYQMPTVEVIYIIQ